MPKNKWIKVKERAEFLRIRDKYVRSDGKRDFMALMDYFEKNPDYESVSHQQLRKWEEHNPPELSSEDEYKRYLEHIKTLAYDPDSLGKYKELYAELMGWRKRSNREGEDKTEFTAADRIRIARELAEGLRQQFRDTGYCPVCQHPTPILGEVCVDTKQEYGEDGEVGELGLPVEVADGVSTE